jgi:3-hydroxyacyl-CoA dehydrogenase/enoyl-CoA hydratase/3-hydroxybutyryl-CoA epimerase/enoyl-CoA isomerase
MIFQGNSLTLNRLEGDIAELCIDLKSESVNKFDSKTIAELGQALEALKKETGIQGLILASGKPVFVVGADITEFTTLFTKSDAEILAYLNAGNSAFCALEDLPYPTVAAINGYALGGGFEICLACDYRVLADSARVGVPEARLGLFPGYGGTCRLPRIIGIDNAVEWIAAGNEVKANDALKVGAVDAVVALDKVRDAALDLCQQAITGKLDYKAKRQPKLERLKHNDIEALMAFTTCKAVVAGQASPKNFPAPIASVEVMERAYKEARAGALKIESETFVKIARTPAAAALVGIFLNDQAMSKTAKGWEKKAKKKVAKAGVLGAGIMGGGIAYQSAYKGIPIVMKDIAEAGIHLGLAEATKLLSKQVEKGRMTPTQMGETLNRITPTLDYEPMKDVDIVVEAVVENPKVKLAVLAEAEKNIPADAILCSNTSSIRITYLAECLQRPENFCGMHFFNPVHAMPLVEVVRAPKTSDEAVARTVAFANAMGKKAIVVKDGPGFLVNRVLFPYFAGFVQLIKEGADFQAIDKVMEKWGWPMGPAYLADVVGIDTLVHAADVMAQSFPDRLNLDFTTAPKVMLDNKRLGQKNGVGFYVYGKDKKGKPTKDAKPDVYDLLKPHVAARKEFSDEDILARMMVPMCSEMARCLDEKIVETAAEADMSLIYGLGFPVFRGGVCRWMDNIGMSTFIRMAEQHKSLGKLYEPTESQRKMAAEGKKYF